MDVRLPDGTVISNVPDGMSKADLTAKLASNGYDTAKLSAPQIASSPRQSFEPEPQSFLQGIAKNLPSIDIQKIQASVPGRIIQGMRDPIDAGAQLLPRGLEFITSAGGLAPNRVSNYLGDEAVRVDKMNADAEKEYQAARIAQTPKTLSNLVTGQSDPGFDAARLVGNILSPANAVIAKALPITPGMTMPGKILTGAAAGASGGALTPTNMDDGQGFASKKAVQIGLGAVAGGIATPILSKVGESIARGYNSILPDKAAQAPDKVNDAITEALASIGQKSEDLSSMQMQTLRDQVTSALKRGKQIDPAALMRKSDFDALGIDPTQGQLTRDATQFAKERNLRGVANVGEPLMTRFEAQNQQLQKIISALQGNPSEAYPAGKKVISALEGIDNELNAPIGPAYQAAKDATGRYANVDVKGFSDSANQALDENMLGAYLPTATRNLLNDVSSGKIPLNVNNLVQMDRTLSAAQRSAGRGTPESLSIGKVRDALNSANIEGEAGQEAKAAFDTAKGLAASRFGAHRDIPALGAVAEGDAIPDSFIQKQVLGGNVDDVQKLAQILRNGGDATQPAFQEAKDQIGAKIMRSAFGENLAGDKLAAPERLAKTIREIGEDKLRAFFNPEEIQQMKQAARVAAYINSSPTASPVNSSNTAGAMMSLLGSTLGKIPGIPAGASLLSAAAGPIKNSRVVDAAMKANIPETATNLTQKQMEFLANMLSVGAPSSGEFIASPLR